MKREHEEVLAAQEEAARTTSKLRDDIASLTEENSVLKRRVDHYKQIISADAAPPQPVRPLAPIKHSFDTPLEGLAGCRSQNLNAADVLHAAKGRSSSRRSTYERQPQVYGQINVRGPRFAWMMLLQGMERRWVNANAKNVAMLCVLQKDQASPGDRESRESHKTREQTKPSASDGAHIGNWRPSVVRRSLAGLHQWRRAPAASSSSDALGCLSTHIGNPIYGAFEEGRDGGGDAQQLAKHDDMSSDIAMRMVRKRHEERVASSHIILAFK